MTNPLVGGDDPFRDTVEGWLEEARKEGLLDRNPVPQCRVCRDPVIMGLVNKLLARAFTLPDILDTLDSHNLHLRREGKPQITRESLKNHRLRHFETQAPAAALWRRIQEKRAVEHGQNWEEGIGTILNEISYNETMMSKGFETLIDPLTVVTPKEGADAAKRLAEIARQDEGALQHAQALAEMGRIIEVVRQFIPSERWPEVQAILRGETPVPQKKQAVESVRMVAIDDSDDENVD